MIINKEIIILALFFLSLTGSALDKQIRMDDWVYEENIKTPLFYESQGRFDDQLNPPVISLYQQFPLVFEFDEIGTNTYNYYYKIIPCNQDWTANSQLLDSEYLKDFINDYLITNYLMSFNTKVKYVHYKFVVPKVKISGNYIVMVYRNDNPDDVVVTRRFMVYDSKVKIAPTVRISNGVEERFTHQQVDFTLSYNTYPYIFNPSQELMVVLRQNNRWDNAIIDLKPLYIKENERVLDFNFFNLENNFPGGKEFRMFDCRKTRTNSMNINYIDITAKDINVYLMQEKSRAEERYSMIFDANGRYIVDNNEVGGNFGDPDYVNVAFDLKLKSMPFGSVYVLGMFNDWRPSEKYKLNFDASSDSYKTKLLLKQGYYNYIYAVKNTKETRVDDIALEGSAYQTENYYEIIVYHRPMGERYDLIIGYYATKYNGNN